MRSAALRGFRSPAVVTLNGVDLGSDLVLALQALEPSVLDGPYAVLGYPRGAAPPSPSALAAEPLGLRLDDPHGTTFVLRAAIADGLPPPEVRRDGLRAIVLADEQPDVVVGLLSTIAGALADRGIPLVPLPGATRTHLLVPERSWPEVLAILRGLRDAARQLGG